MNGVRVDDWTAELAIIASNETVTQEDLKLENDMISTIGRMEKLQGLFVPSARVGSGDPVRVLHLFHNEYTRYNWSIYC